MIKSMTGYGKADISENGRYISLEFKSVNSRYFDCNIRLPKSLIVLEDSVRKKLNSSISRGKVDVFINYKNLEKNNVDIRINETVAGKYIEAFRAITEKYFIKDDISASMLSGLDDVIVIEENSEDTDTIWQMLSDVIERAIRMHDDMRLAEGNNLKKDLLIKKSVIDERLREIEKIVPEIVPAFREKLTERIKEMEIKNFDEERILQEIALYSDKSSIDEEITRLKSHMDQFEKMLNLDEPVGRKLDFLIQEMNREANTMASKSVSIELTNKVLDIKNEIEKIREQAQNIE